MFESQALSGQPIRMEFKMESRDDYKASSSMLIIFAGAGFIYGCYLLFCGVWMFIHNVAHTDKFDVFIQQYSWILTLLYLACGYVLLHLSIDFAISQFFTVVGSGEIVRREKHCFTIKGVNCLGRALEEVIPVGRKEYDMYAKGDIIERPKKVLF